MITEIETLKNLAGGGWTSVAAKRCDSCKTAAAAAFCRVDSAFLCLNCDSNIHGVNSPLARHERVWMCEVCEQAPAAVTCRADAAALCVTCDADIHSANPLARRHERVPVEPFYDSAESIVKSSPFSFLGPSSGNGQPKGVSEAGGIVSWLLPNPKDHLNSKMGLESLPDVKSGDLSFTNMVPFLEFDYQNSMDSGRFHHQQNNSSGADSVVPARAKAVGTIDPAINYGGNGFDIDFCRSKLSSFSYPTQSISQSVSSSSLDVGVVPDGSAMSDMFGRNMSGGSDPRATASAGTARNQAAQSCGIDREARVLRYRERRKNRKFEKTIRYASRKAYAETRPRIKGRFAKRPEIDSDVDHLYNSPVTFTSEIQYGVVPSL